MEPAPEEAVASEDWSSSTEEPSSPASGYHGDAIALDPIVFDPDWATEIANG